MAGSPTITQNGDREFSAETRALGQAFDQAVAGHGKLSNETLAMVGMSGRLYRLFINNLIGAIPGARYLEVGSWAGSTACAAIEGNTVRITCIDNWSQFGDRRDEFMINVEARLSDQVEFDIIENDFRAIDYESIGKYGVYMFDGPHELIDQYDGLHLALPALDSVFYFIVDDWNWPQVREGVRAAIESTDLEELFSIEIRTTSDDSHPKRAWQHSDWHNGYFLGVLGKP